MPVDWSKYPDNWKEIVAQVAARSGGQCECGGQCGACRSGVRCLAVNRLPHPDTGSKVVLTTAHLDHDTMHNEMGNLMHACQSCHLRYDRTLHTQNARRTRIRRREEAGQMRLDADPSPDSGKVSP